MSLYIAAVIALAVLCWCGWQHGYHADWLSAALFIAMSVAYNGGGCIGTIWRHIFGCEP